MRRLCYRVIGCTSSKIMVGGGGGGGQLQHPEPTPALPIPLECASTSIICVCCELCINVVVHLCCELCVYTHIMVAENVIMLMETAIYKNNP